MRIAALPQHVRLRSRRLPLLCITALLTLQANRIVEAVVGPAEISEAHASFLAERFAPKLIFHPNEQFFPSSPLFSLEDTTGQDGQSLEAGDLLEILGTPEQRREQYLALNLREKARLATVYYRVNRLPTAIVIEYWFYYIWNDYSARPGLVPFWFNGSHPNDLEHLHIVLEPDPEVPASSDAFQATSVRLATIYVSAHDGVAPANRYYSNGETHDGETHLIVELGSHAAGTDANRDGVFTPGDDGESGYKILWGIRDRGFTWSRYNPAYMDSRANGDAVSFCPNESSRRTVCPSNSLSYQLVPVAQLYRQFDELALSREQYQHAFETKVHPLKRFFGRSNGDYEKLVIPPASAPERESSIDNFSSTERGVMFGLTTVGFDPGVFFGERYSFLHGSKFIPDLLLQADPVLTFGGQGLFSTAALASYPISAMSKVLIGVGFISDFEESQWDLIAGLEFRPGGFRLSVTGRTLGKVTESVLDLRLFYFF